MHFALIKVFDRIRDKNKNAKLEEVEEDIQKAITYMELNKVSNKTAFLELKDLVEKNILIKEGRGRAVTYRFKR